MDIYDNLMAYITSVKIRIVFNMLYVYSYIMRIVRYMHTIIINIEDTLSSEDSEMDSLLPTTSNKKQKYTYIHKGTPTNAPIIDNKIAYDMCVVHTNDIDRAILKPNENVTDYHMKSEAGLVCFAIKYNDVEHIVSLKSPDYNYYVCGNKLDHSFARYILNKYYSINTQQLSDEEFNNACEIWIMRSDENTPCMAVEKLNHANGEHVVITPKTCDIENTNEE